MKNRQSATSQGGRTPSGQILRQCANTVKDEKSEMGAYFRRMKSKDGYMQAIVATAHKIVRIIYTMVKTRKKNLGLKTAR